MHNIPGVYNVTWRGKQAKFLVTNPHDLIQACFVRGHFFSVEELEDLLFYVRPNTVVLDIGANVGNHTVFFAMFAQAKTVLPFEVNPSASSLLKSNIELNHLANVDASHVGLGLGARRGHLLPVSVTQDNLGATSYAMAAAANSGGDLLNVDALDAILPEQAQVDFIKIDVEGMEFDVLEGAP